jgi:hypothetical protein
MTTERWFRVVFSVQMVSLVLLGAGVARGQELGGAGTVQGTVKDPTGGVMVSVVVNLSNPLTGLRRTSTTDASGKFVFRNLPPNPYHIEIAAQGFQTLERDVDVRTAVPIDLDLSLALAGATATVQVVGHAEDLLERDPTAHTDVDQSVIDKLLVETQSGLNQVITLASPGIAADANGFFHPIGDHAQTQVSKLSTELLTETFADARHSRLFLRRASTDATLERKAC